MPTPTTPWRSAAAPLKNNATIAGGGGGGIMSIRPPLKMTGGTIQGNYGRERRRHRHQ